MKIYQVTENPWGSNWHYLFCITTSDKEATVLSPHRRGITTIDNDNFDFPGSSAIYSE